MFRKSTLLAVAASAALGLAMLSPTIASAKGHGGGGHGGGGHGGGMHGGHHGGHHVHHRHRHPNWHVRYHRPIWYGVRPVYTAYSTRVVTPGPCTCLSKEYTPDGRVLFKDRCTNEAAMNPPMITPQQTGSIDAPVQQAANTGQYQATPPNAMQQVDPTTGLPK
jgi:hypothetical protein